MLLGIAGGAMHLTGSVAGLLKEVTDVAYKTGSSVVKKGSEVGEIGIVNGNILAKEKKINDLHRIMGKIIIDENIETNNKDIKKEVEKAKKICLQIIEYKSQIEKLKKYKK